MRRATPTRRATVAALGGLLAIAATACGSSSTDNGAAASKTTDAAATTAAASVATEAPTVDAKTCAADKTLTKGTLTVATGDPAFPPYVIDDKPESGQGFEAAVALAVAKQMGFEGTAVKWVRTSFDTAVAGSDKTFDFNLQQISITDERKQAVSFSQPYYTSNQAILGYTDGPAKDAKSIADLSKLKLGAAASTTSVSFITDVIKPTAEPFVFNSNADAKTALDNKQIDAIIADLPTALFISAVEIEGTTVFGQFPVDAGGQGDSWGLLFTKDNPLVACADTALTTLTSSGELATITSTWMGDSQAPTLK